MGQGDLTDAAEAIRRRLHLCIERCRYVTQQCPDLLAAVRNIQRFLPLISDASPMQLKVDARELVLSWPESGQRYDHLIEQLTVAVAVHCIRKIATISVLPERVQVTHPPLGQDKAYQQALQCSVSFSARNIEIAYDRRDR